MPAVKLKELDCQVLSVLLQDGRTNFAEIADCCGVTKNKVWKRYAVMARKGIITGATIQVNFAKFGYDALATILINVEARQIDQVMEYIRRITEVRAHRQYNSIYNIRAFAALKNLNELDLIKQALKRKLPTVGLRTYIWTDVRNIPENLGIIRSANKIACGRFGEPENKGTRTKIDGLDDLLVKKLTADGRASFSEIAKAIGASTDTAMKRYQRLRNQGAIKVSIQIDPNKLGYTALLDFNLSFTGVQNFSSTVVESLAKIPDLIIITRISGDYDLQLTAMVRDMAEYFEIQDQIARICGVTKMEVNARKIPSKWPSPQQYISTM